MKKRIFLLIVLAISFTIFVFPNDQNTGIETVASSLIENIFGKLNGNYVVGDPIKAGNMMLIPLCSVEISFGGGLGGSPAIGGGGVGKVNVVPKGFLMIEEGRASFISVEKPSSQKDTFEKAMEIFDRVYPIIMQFIKNWQSQAKSKDIPKVDEFKISDLFEKAKEFYKSGDLENAYSKLEEYLKKDPDNISAHLMLAKVSGELAQKSQGVDRIKYALKSMKEYEKILSLDPKNLEGLIGYGYSKLYAPAPLGSLKQAKENFEKALKLDPQNIEALLGMAQTLERMGFEQEAKGYYKKILELDPDNEEAKKALESK